MADFNGTPGNDSLAGTADADNFYGGAGNDTLLGLGGADFLNGAAGNDVIDGGVVADRAGLSDINSVSYETDPTGIVVNLSGITGNGSVGQGTATDGWGGIDTLRNVQIVRGSSFNDSIQGSSADIFEMFDGGLGNDTIDGGAITGNNGNRVSYQRASGSVTVDFALGSATGADGTDVLRNINQVRGSNSGDFLYGSNTTTYTEFFEGRGGNDFIDGRGGFDMVRYDAATEGVSVNLVTGVALDGQGGTDTLVGIEGAQGTRFNDILTGGNAQGGVVLEDGLAEVFRGGGGNDTIDGGQGYDRAEYDTSSSGIYLDFGAGSAQDGLGGTDTLLNIEGARGSSHGDTLIGSEAYFESFEGGAGNDTIDGKGGWDRVDYRYLAGSGVNVDLAAGTATDGQGGVDTLSNIEMVRGSVFNDTLAGDAQDNKLEGWAGNDSLTGHSGSDTLQGGDGNDTMLGGVGNDELSGGAGSDSVDGGEGNDNLWGGAGADTLVGGSGWDWAQFWDATAGVSVNLAMGTATGGGGADKLSGIEAVGGSNFNDTLTGDANNNDFAGGLGNDTITGGGGFDRVGYWGVTESVVVNLAAGSTSGAMGVDQLVGISGAQGGDAGDVLIGNTAVNRFNGGEGADTIDGAEGSDWAEYNQGGAVTVDLAAGTATGQGNDTLVSIENVSGSGQDDTLAGNVSGNRLEGNAGNDSIFGAGGQDVLLGGQGNDTLDGGVVTDRAGYTDINTVSYAGDPGGVTVNLSGITGDGSAGQGTATDGWGNTDTLHNVQIVIGSAGNDSIQGSAAEILEMFEGGAGNDTIDGGAISGNATNRLSYTNATGSVTVDLQSGTSTGAAGNDLISNFNQVRASGFNDTLLGSDTTDYTEMFDGRGGSDHIDGRGGFDMVRYDQAPTTTGVSVNLTTGTASDGQAGTDKLFNIEGARGTDFNDTLVGSALDNRLEGRDGNDSISAADGADTLLGGAGNDTLDGGAGADTVVLDGDFDEYTITRPTATDVQLVRGANTTTVRNVENLQFADGVHTLADILSSTGSPFNDSLAGDEDANLLDGGAGNDTLLGLGGNDTLQGGLGDDSLAGGAGDDSLAGGAGNDTYEVDTASDVVVEALNGGTDTVRVVLTTGSHTLADNVEHATITSSAAVGITGNALNNVLTGNDEANMLNGAVGNDTLNGGAGNDTLDGGVGTDSLTGGLGDDTYVVEVAGDVVFETADQGTDQVQVAFETAGTYTLGLNVENALIATNNTALKVNLTGNAGNNRLRGSNGDNVLSGGAGDDTLVALGGNDTLDGGTGTGDRAVLFGSYENYSVARISATDTRLTHSVTGYVTIVRNAELFEFAGGQTLTAAELFFNTASIGNDAISGTAQADLIDGLAGNDSLSGLSGNDTLIGGLGDDSLVGGEGDDSLVGGAGNDTYMVDAVGDEVVEGLNAGTDLVGVELTAGVFTLGANVENATITSSAAVGITGNALNNVLTGNEEANALSGAVGNDTLNGGGGNDTLDGGAGIDRMTGGLGDDTYVVDVAGDVISEATGADTDTVQVAFAAAGTYSLALNVENAVITTANTALKVNLTGNAGNNVLTGNGGDNMLSGGAGDDTLVGGLGNDTLDGGTGAADRAVFGGNYEDYVVARISASDIRLTHSGTGQVTIVRGTEVFEFSGGTRTAAELIANTASIGNDAISGTALADLIDGLAGNDSLSGLAGNDTLAGGLGDDTLVGGEGDDSLEGGAGNDAYEVDSQNDVVVEALNGGTDLVRVALGIGSYTLGVNVENATITSSAAVGITGNALNNVLTGNEEANALSGAMGNDTLNGGAGNDTLDGGVGIDRMTGGLGDDTYVVDVAGDVISETTGQGADTVQVAFALAGTYTLGLNVENGVVTTANPALKVNLTGNAGDNLLTGNAGANVLSGAAGHDTLAGALGKDTLTGGTGTDHFVFDTAPDLANVDTITDFKSGEDKIVLSASVFTALGGAGSPVNLGGEHLSYNVASGALLYDADGAGGAAAVQIAILGSTTHPALVSGDFLLI